MGGEPFKTIIKILDKLGGRERDIEFFDWGKYYPIESYILLLYRLLAVFGSLESE